MPTLGPAKLPPSKFLLMMSLAVALESGQSVAHQQVDPRGKKETRENQASIPPDYVCLDEAVKATTADGSTVFLLIQAKHGECESAVVPSPLSREDRDLLYKMSVAASNISALREADELRETSRQERAWAPMIEMGVKDFRQMRTQLCSRHSDMFVYELKEDGERTAPTPCAQQSGRPSLEPKLR